MWTLLADLTVGLHYAFLAYLVVGGFVAWRWAWTIVAHVLAAIWGLLIVVVKVQCPLTWLQNAFRAQDGTPALHGGFIDVYVKGTLYPADLEGLAQVVVLLAVLGSWVGLVVRRRHTPAARMRADNGGERLDPDRGRIPPPA